jgi:ribonuclease VapC
MIVDSSALVAISWQEPGYQMLQQKALEAPWAGIGAPSLLETGMVLSRTGDGLTEAQDLVRDLGLAEIGFGASHWEEAVRAFQRYGKGRHPAGLNFGDCMSYALARVEGQPLLFAGDDFSQTDIRAA